MPSRFDPILMLHDTIELATEQPYIDPDLIVGLYQHLTTVHERQPSLEEARDYVSRITAVVPEESIRAHLAKGGSDAPADTDETRNDRAAPDEQDRPAGPRRGRPAWTPELFSERYGEALARSEAPHTFRSIAQHFLTLDGNRGTDAEYVRKLARRFGTRAA